jgi:hypothetical protein
MTSPIGLGRVLRAQRIQQLLLDHCHNRLLLPVVGCRVHVLDTTAAHSHTCMACELGGRTAFSCVVGSPSSLLLGFPLVACHPCRRGRLCWGAQSRQVGHIGSHLWLPQSGCMPGGACSTNPTCLDQARWSAPVQEPRVTAGKVARWPFHADRCPSSLHSCWGLRKPRRVVGSQWAAILG